MPKYFLAFLVAIALLITPFFVMIPRTHADELEDLNKQISQLSDSLNKSVAATKPLESELTSLQNQVTSIRNRIAGVEVDITTKKKEIDNGYRNLAQKQLLFQKTVRQFYMDSYSNSPLLIFLASDTASEVTQALAYQRAKTDQDKALITSIALSITDLEKKSEALKIEETSLVTARANLDTQSTKLATVITGAKAYQKDVSTQLASLTAKQNEILNARSGSFTASIGDSDEADDLNASIKGFRDSAPGGSFAAFSFGAYTHRKGMSQYGAYARAKSGQDFKAILKAYYGKEPVGKDTSGTIKVTGAGDIDFEGRYLYGIAEMPSSWHPEALKAQAVAARTYAYRYKADGKEICNTEACQVYSSSKADNPPAAWKQAVDDTKGQVLEDVVTYFSSTSGGYLSTSGWDTTDGQGGSNFSDRAYEKMAGSPWFYKAWYTKGYSISSEKCGRSNPWLTSSDMSDIINGYFVLYNGGSGDETGRVTPPSCWGGNPYSSGELQSVSNKYGGGISSVTGVTVSQGNGSTNEVVFQTDKGEKRLSGSNFKTAFNLRAPGYLSIPQNGFAFFNIEKK
jgi:peptidoglycan hydrolase-like amidase/peptidoglycan hydrolase CwlO-like protein